MTDTPRLTLTEEDLLYLEQHIERLVRACGQLQEENRVLRDRQAGLVAERAELIEKTELARARVESMIIRLKAMETEL
ncbi:cell division protein ZapB [Gammaproteobacteria bacterium]